MFAAVLTSFVTLLCSSGLVDGRAVWRDVIDPPILYPTSGTVWNVGESHNVTWNTSIIPPGNNNTGMIVLGFEDPADGGNEHLDLDHPLAKGFLLTAGRAEIIVPMVATRDTYIIVLFGDSGNASPQFTIKDISITSPPPPSSTTVFVTTPVPASSIMASIPSASPVAGDAASPPASDASSFQTSPASGLVGSSMASLPLAPTPAVSSAISSTLASPIAQSASPTKIPNAGARFASLGPAATWGLTSCSIAVALLLAP